MTNLYSISYNVNNATSGNTPPTQTAESNSETYTFTAPTAKQYELVRTGYTFMGWAESPTASVEHYQGGTTISLDSNKPHKTLYAIWGLPYTLKYATGDGSGIPPADETITIAHLPYEYTPTGSYANIFRVGHLANGWNKVTFTETDINLTTTPTWVASNANNFNTMQDIVNTGYCDAIGNTGRRLFDVRDGSSYTVKKLSDEKCWMTENLRIVDKKISSTDSNLESGEYTIPASSNPWSDTDANTNKVHYAGNEHYGAYYTWYTATASTGDKLVSTNSKDYPASASGSICPKGWRLPAGGSSGEFQALYDKGKSGWITHDGINGYWLGGTANASGAAFFPAAGLVISGTLSNAGSDGRYWSSTAKDASYACLLTFSSYGVNSSDSNVRYWGMSVRCVAR